MKTELKTLRETIAKIIKEGDVVDLNKFRKEKQTSQLEDVVASWRETLIEEVDDLLGIREILEGQEREIFNVLMEDLMKSSERKALNQFLQEIINRKNSTSF